MNSERRLAKANAAQAIPELIQIAVPTNNTWEENKEKKHSKDAQNGWYRYNVRFGIPVYNNDGELERYNIFTAIMLVRHDEDGKKYLYDLTTIKKKRVARLSHRLYGENPFLIWEYYNRIRDLSIRKIEKMTQNKLCIQNHCQSTEVS